MKTNRPFPEKISRRVFLGILILIGVFISGCGEEKLPPPPPPDSGTITVTGGAV